MGVLQLYAPTAHTNLWGLGSPVPFTFAFQPKAQTTVRVAAGPESSAIPMPRFSGVSGVPAFKAGSARETARQARDGGPAGGLEGAMQALTADASGAPPMTGASIPPLRLMATR